MKTLILLSSLLLVSGCFANTQEYETAKNSADDKRYYYENIRPENYNIDYDMLDHFCDDCLGVDHNVFCPLVVENYNNMASDETMALERRYDEILGFSTPEWESVLLEKIDWNLVKSHAVREEKTEEGKEARWEKAYPIIYERASKQGVFWKASFNLDNDANNTLEQVYRYKIYDGKCEESLENCRQRRSFQPNYIYFVVNPETNTYDPFYKRMSGVNERFFFYKGKTYSSFWNGSMGSYPDFGSFLKILRIIPASPYRASSRPDVSHSHSICLISERVNY